LTSGSQTSTVNDKGCSDAAKGQMRAYEGHFKVLGGASTHFVVM